MPRWVFALQLTILILPACAAFGDFATTINVPPDVAPAGIDSSTQLNLADGGSLPNAFYAGLSDGSSIEVEVNILGGYVGGGFQANGGSVVNIVGGRFSTEMGSALRVNSGSVVNIAGGRLGAVYAKSGSSTVLSGGVLTAPLFTNSGSEFRILGDDFRLDGQPIAGLVDVGDAVPVNVSTNSLLSGILADGTPFAFANSKADFIAFGTLTLEVAELAAVGKSMIHVPGDAAPNGIRAGQTLVVSPGGALDSYFMAGWGSLLQIDGGNVGAALQAIGADVTMTDGHIGNLASFYAGSEVEIAGGEIGDGLTVNDGAALRISGGRMGNAPHVSWGGRLEISGGAGFDVPILDAVGESSMTIVGNEFRVNGVLLTDPELSVIGGEVSVPAHSVITGVLADGTPFSLGWTGTNTPQTLRAAELPPIGPSVIDALTDEVPLGIREGQSLTIGPGASVGRYFQAGRDSRVVVAGGELGQGMDAVHAAVDLVEGSIGSLVNISEDSVLNLIGGTIEAPPSNYIGATTLSIGGSVANVSGGLIDGRVVVSGASGELNLSGGQIAGSIRVYSGSELHIFGTKFALDGDDISSELTQNLPHLVTDRGMILSGLLTDGTPFEIALNPSSSGQSQDFVDPLATVTVSLILPGDYNSDGVVDAADYTRWRDSLGQNVDRGSGADGDFDGRIALADYEIWKDNLGTLLSQPTGVSSEAAYVPEPSITLFVSSFLVFTGLRRSPCSVRQLICANI